MMTEEITALARAMGAAAEDELLRTLCRAAQGELTALLKSGIAPEDCGGAFPVACALLTLSVLEAGEGDVSAFSAGEVTIHRQTSPSQRQTQAMALLAPYLKERGFAFRGVRG